MSFEQQFNIVSNSMSMAVAIFAILILIGQNRIRVDKRIFLGLFFLFFSFLKLDNLYLRTDAFYYLPHASGLLFVAKLFLPPIIFYYVKAVTSPSTIKLTVKDLSAISLPFAGVLVSLPYFALSAEDKIALISMTNVDNELYDRAILGCQIGLALFVLSSAFYLTKSLLLFRQHTEKLMLIFSKVDDKEFDALRKMINLIIAAWFIYSICEMLYFQGYNPDVLYPFYFIFELLWIVSFAYISIKSSLENIYDETKKQEASGDNASSKDLENRVYSRSGLTDQQREKIAARLENTMTNEKLYMDPNLSLSDLSQAIKYPQISLSETFNKQLNTNFFEFVNRYRIRKACELLQETNLNITDIALESGFNSRSTFNTAFKKFEGVTPSQYRKENFAQINSQ